MEVGVDGSRKDLLAVDFQPYHECRVQGVILVESKLEPELVVDIHREEEISTRVEGFAVEVVEIRVLGDDDLGDR